MKKEKELELKEKNRRFREVLKEIILEEKDSDLKNRLLKRVLRNEKCNIVSHNSKLNVDFKHSCNDNFCQICLRKKRQKRYRKITKSFEISREKIEKDFAESFVTLNLDYTKIEVNNVDEVVKFYKEKILNKFLRKVKKLDTLGYICNIELPYVPAPNNNNNNWQIHSHLVICIKKNQLTDLQNIFKEVCENASLKGNLHFGGKKKIKMYYESEKNRRNKDFNESRIANYLAKSFLQFRTKVNAEIKNQVVEKITKKEEIKKLIEATENKLKSFQNLKIWGIYDINKEKREREKARKEEKSRVFLIKEYENKNIKNAEVFENKEEKVLVLKFKSNNKTVDKIEKETKGKVEAIKGRNTFKNLLQEYNLKQIEAETEVNNNIITSEWKKEATVFIEKEVDFEKLEMLQMIEEKEKEMLRMIEEKEKELRIKNKEIKAITKSYVKLFNLYIKSEAKVEKRSKIEKQNEELRFKNQILKVRNEEINSKYNDLVIEYFKLEWLKALNFQILFHSPFKISKGIHLEKQGKKGKNETEKIKIISQKISKINLTFWDKNGKIKIKEKKWNMDMLV